MLQRVKGPHGVELPECDPLDRQTKRSYGSILKDIFVQYTQTTSLHGLKFIGDRNISEAQRWFFLSAFIVSVLLSGYYISSVYMKWRQTPLIITASSQSTPITSIPFPAITICNLNQAKKSLINTKDYAKLQTLCKHEPDSSTKYVNETDGDWEQFKEFILKVSHPCEEMLISCRYGPSIQYCPDAFESILTDVGVCCTFNNLHPDFIFTEYSRENVIDDGNYTNIKSIKWNPDEGFEKNLPKDFFPRKALGTGINMSLTIVVNASVNEYFCSSTKGVGFKILLHNPAEIAKITNYGYLLSAGVETQIVIHDSAPNVRRVRREARHCVFANEVNLRFYRIYTEDNCELECESERLVQECGCITHYLPRASKHTAVCSLSDFQCVQRVQHESELLLNINTSCARCKPGCVSLSYLPEISSTDLLRTNFVAKENLTNRDMKLDELAIFHFFFNADSFTASRKEEYQGFVDFLASSGGILGLFLGFSILSVVEFLYFLFLVQHAMMKNYIKKKQNIFDYRRHYFETENFTQSKLMESNDNETAFKTIVRGCRNILSLNKKGKNESPSLAQFPYNE